MANKVRVLIVDDSALMREALKSLLEENPSIEVIGIAKDGKEGVEKALALRPDVITMDLKMPLLSGIEAIERIMEECPIPIIVVSGMDTEVIVKALSLGAMDFVSVTQDIEFISRELSEKILIAARVRPLRRLKIKKSPARDVCRIDTKRPASKIVAIGVSTGGPQALEVVLSRLPADFNAGILVVQHMSKGFISGMAEWLNTTSHLKVKVGNTGDSVTAGMIFLAPDSYHMLIDTNGRILLKEELNKNALHVPSITATMKSAAENYGSEVVGVIMTGMGSDGLEGIKAIKKAGGMTISQDEKTSIVFGMNKAAIDSGAIDRILPLERIAEELISAIKGD